MFYCKACSKNLPATSFTTPYFRKIRQLCREHRRYKKCTGECNIWHPASAFSKHQVGRKTKKCRKCVANAFVHKSTKKSFCSGGYGLPVFYKKIKSVPRIGKFWNEKQYKNHCSGIHLYMYTCIHVCICIHVYVFWD